MSNGTRKLCLRPLSAGLLVLLCGIGTVSAYSFDFIMLDRETITLKLGVGYQIAVNCVTDNIPADVTTALCSQSLEPLPELLTPSQLSSSLTAASVLRVKHGN
jgi:hypothetical protein